MGPGGPNPFGFDLSQFFRMLQSSGPVNWEIAGQVAAWMADADPESGQPRTPAPTDPAAAAAFSALVRAAQTAVADATGLDAVYLVESRCVDRRAWADGTLAALHTVLGALAESLAEPADDAGDSSEAGDEPGAAEVDPFAGIVGALLPLLVGVWAGSMIGFLAQGALGQYDLPLPLEGEPRLTFVASNVDEFAREWSLPPDDVRYVLALREVVHAAQRSVPWVRDRLVRLAREYVSGYELRADALEGQLGELDFSDPSAFGDLAGAGELVGDPSELLGAMRSDRQLPALEELRRFVCVLEGYADVVVARLGTPMVPSFAQIDEALRRRRVERGRAGAFVDRLLGLELDREHYEQGVAFCTGVIERAGLEGCNRLWAREAMVPTPAELTAPGLWLARIELPDA